MIHSNVLLRLALCLLAAFATMPLAAQVSCTSETIVAGPVDNKGEKIHETKWAAQSFLAPGSVCFQLSQITVNVCKDGSPSNLVFEIHDASSGIPAPGATPLASASLTPASVSTACGNGSTLNFESKTITFGMPPSLTGGSAYALLVHQAGNAGSGSNYYRVGVREDNPYGFGQYCKWETSAWSCPAGPGGGLDVPLSICTLPCACSGCTYTQGFWKNHEEGWPVSSLLLGSSAYTQAQLLAIWDTPPAGNALIQLAHQLSAAKLNAANGACVPSSVAAAMAAADALIGSLVVPPLGTGYLAPGITISGLVFALDTYNSGCTAGGPPHCDGPEECPLPPE